MDKFKELLESSSLGTPGASLLRSTTPESAAARALEVTRGCRRDGAHLGARDDLRTVASVQDDAFSPGGGYRSSLGLTVPQRPDQLPPDTEDFCGRSDQLEQLRNFITGRSRTSAAVSIWGGPGVGKSALAVRLGHMVRESFPNGQIYLDMHGSTLPRDAGSALAHLLRGLGIPDPALPADLELRSAAFRSELAGLQMLIILDDVYSARQIAPLMPEGGRSAVVITSRSRLTDLGEIDNIELGTLSDEEATELLHRVAGPKQIDDQLSAACGNLPLAIRIVARQVVQQSDIAATETVERLRMGIRRLDDAGVGDAAVRTGADLSYRRLAPDHARLYRLIGHLAVGPFVARSLEAAVSRAVVRRGLDRLVEANLVQISSVDPTGTVQYRLPCQLQRHAIEVGNEAEKGQVVNDLTTVLESFLGMTRRACAALPNQYFGVPEHADSMPRVDPELLTGAEALAWFDRERGRVIPTIQAAAFNGLHDWAWRIATGWCPYFDMRAAYDDWLESHHIGLASAQMCGDRRGEAIVHRNLGQLALYREDWESTWSHFSEAAVLFDKTGERHGAAFAEFGLGAWMREHDRSADALAYLERALDAFVEVGDRSSEALIRCVIASIWLSRNEIATASRYLASAFLIGARLGDPHRIAKVRRRIADLRGRQGRHAEAVRQLQIAVATFDRIGDDPCAAFARTSLGDALVDIGEEDAARQMLLEAIEAGRRIGDPHVVAHATSCLGELCGQAGDHFTARRYLGRAVRIWRLIGEDRRAAETHRRLAALAVG